MHGIGIDERGWLRIGAAESLSAIEHSPIVQREHPALAEAAGLVSTPQVRTVGTLGGNVCLDVRCNYYNQSEHWRRSIGYCMKNEGSQAAHVCRVAPGGDRCWAVSSADTVPVLIALDAEAHILARAGERRQSVATLYQDDGLTPLTLQPGEILTEVRIPPAGGMRTVYSKLRLRQSFDFPLVGAAVGVAISSSGVVERARIVLTAVGSHPIEVVNAESILIGQKLTPELIAAAGEQVYRMAKPMDNTEGSIPHRKRMARIYVERALRRVAGDHA
jgi:4-hydroxybenzoyl-CoA reductase subunit beta